MILRPDEYGHNNPLLSFTDGNRVRGGRRAVASRTDLYALTANADQLKQDVTVVRVLSDSENNGNPSELLLVNAAQIGSAAGWAPYAAGAGNGATGDTITGVTLSGASVLTIATDRGNKTVDLTALAAKGDTIASLSLSGTTLTLVTDTGSYAVNLASLQSSTGEPTVAGDTITSLAFTTATNLRLTTDQGVFNVDLAAFAGKGDTISAFSLAGNTLTLTTDLGARAVDLSTYRDRSQHTGTQAIDTITGLLAALEGKAEAQHTHPLGTTTVPGFSTNDYNALTNKPAVTIPYWAALARTSTDNQTVQQAIDAAVTTQKNRIDAILGGADSSLDTFIEALNRFASDELAVVNLTNTVGQHTTRLNGLATVATTGSYNDLLDKPTFSADTVPLWQAGAQKAGVPRYDPAPQDTTKAGFYAAKTDLANSQSRPSANAANYDLLGYLVTDALRTQINQSTAFTANVRVTRGSVSVGYPSWQAMLDAGRLAISDSVFHLNITGDTHAGSYQLAGENTIDGHYGSLQFNGRLLLGGYTRQVIRNLKLVTLGNDPALGVVEMLSTVPARVLLEKVSLDYSAQLKFTGPEQSVTIGEYLDLSASDSTYRPWAVGTGEVLVPYGCEIRNPGARPKDDTVQVWYLDQAGNRFATPWDRNASTGGSGYTDAQARAANAARFLLVEGDVTQAENDINALENEVGGHEDRLDAAEIELTYKLDTRRMAYRRTGNQFTYFDTVHEALAGIGSAVVQHVQATLTQSATVTTGSLTAGELTLPSGVVLTLDRSAAGASFVGSGSIKALNGANGNSTLSGIVRVPLVLEDGFLILRGFSEQYDKGLPWVTGTGHLVIYDDCDSGFNTDRTLRPVDISRIGAGITWEFHHADGGNGGGTNNGNGNTPARQIVLQFPLGSTNETVGMILSSDAGSYGTQSLHNVGSVSYFINNVPAALPLGLVDGDTLRCVVTCSDASKGAYLILSN
ncbi:hypothetical protein [Hymenobacter sp. BT491]|uniref:hypothetical protein n=1 Tax=Hymenobacter sp. BT491 TaxID=2766779 RepID=UPI001653B411|nr:hypothetical protein [Hymenobacter sp. BT491]MBC6988927.1 hypothetical protein [Hymenobacter sp. BT491]